MATTTIAIERADKDRLDTFKEHERETYGDVVRRLLDLAEAVRKQEPWFKGKAQ